MPNKREVEFEPEVQEYLNLKSQSTAHAYSNSFARFLEFYQSKYGKDANFGHFLDRIFEEKKKPRREQSTQNIFINIISDCFGDAQKNLSTKVFTNMNCLASGFTSSKNLECPCF